MEKNLSTTKIICTLGPASNDPKTILSLMNHGMSIIRLNFSHRKEGFAEYEKILENINSLRDGIHNFIGIAIDTKGPEIRTQNLSSQIIDIVKGDMIIFLCDDHFNIDLKQSEYVEKNSKLVENVTFEKFEKILDNLENKEYFDSNKKCKDNISDIESCKTEELKIHKFNKKNFDITKENNSININNEAIKSTQRQSDKRKVIKINLKKINEVKPGSIFSIDDGFLQIRVINCNDKYGIIEGEALNDHKLLTHKSVNFPGIIHETPFLSIADKEDILFGIKNYADFIFASFVSSKEDVIELKKFISENLNDSGHEPLVISKIECKMGYGNLDEIIESSDGIMIARGDMGAEFDIEELLVLQKIISRRCIEKRKPFIVATQMIESMCKNIIPTRAEISDIGNAVLDGADCIMTSSETAIGSNPIAVVEIMRKICQSTEKYIYSLKICEKLDFFKKFFIDCKPNLNEKLNCQSENTELTTKTNKDAEDFSVVLSIFDNKFIETKNKYETTEDPTVLQNKCENTNIRDKNNISSKLLLGDKEFNDQMVTLDKRDEHIKRFYAGSDAFECIQVKDKFFPINPHSINYKDFFSNKFDVGCIVYFCGISEKLCGLKRISNLNIPVFVVSNKNYFLRRISLIKSLFPYKVDWCYHETIKDKELITVKVEEIIQDILTRYGIEKRRILFFTNQE